MGSSQRPAALSSPAMRTHDLALDRARKIDVLVPTCLAGHGSSFFMIVYDRVLCDSLKETHH